MFHFIIFLCVQQTFCKYVPTVHLRLTTGVTKTNNVTDKNIKLADIIKEDLRRNNDDYKEAPTLSNPYIEISQLDTTTNNGKTKDISSTRNNKLSYKEGKDLVNAQRRSNKGRRDYDVALQENMSGSGETWTGLPRKSNNSSFGEATPFYPPPQVVWNNNKKFIVDTRTVNVPINLITLPSTAKDGRNPNIMPANKEQYPKYVHKQKMDKFKKFAKKNEGLFKNFVSSKMETRVTQHRTTKRWDTTPSKLALRVGSTSEEVSEEKPKSTPDIYKLPDPEQLDMAPARGGRIHVMRIKGRLCHRNVLVPEGPKYDSKGKIYLQAYTPINRKDYSQTKAPKFMLPKCCNCCKKSVLGCE